MCDTNAEKEKRRDVTAAKILQICADEKMTIDEVYRTFALIYRHLDSYKVEPYKPETT